MRQFYEDPPYTINMLDQSLSPHAQYPPTRPLSSLPNP
ncbi:hypothetical protein PtrM4_110260 [Pyrenophora tritici-repentis]|uniref:Uncharacterized protein n=1 Tax=Pyrenophora tritici-repentis TaxID=45151 RepID=A0A834RW64_9PLEO|nr:hypothetical protein PtrM4_110260 [Pyrenophora tritici-repentis]